MINKLFRVQLAESPDTVYRTARRIIVHPDVLKSSKLCTADVVAISKGDNDNFAIGSVWPRAEISPEAVIVSSSLALTACLKAGQKACLCSLEVTTPELGIPSLHNAKEATSVKLREIGSEKIKRVIGAKNWLQLLVRELLVDLKYITTKQVIEVVYEQAKRRFTVVAVSSAGDSLETQVDTVQISNTTPTIWKCGWDTSIAIVEDPAYLFASTPKTSKPYESIGGLEKQIEQIRDLLELPLTKPELFRHFNLKPPRGILLHGPPGTGKTHLARAIAASTKSAVLVINGPELSSAYHGETESRLRDVFTEAKAKSPCIVILDEVDALVPRREEGAGGEVEKRVVATLLTLLDGIEDDGPENSRVVVIGTTNRPNAIDPALRRPGRFDREIEIGVPDIEGRLSILRVLLSKAPHSVLPDDLLAFASRAHGYVGADLSALVREAGTLAIKRHLRSPTSTALEITLSDLVDSLPSVRPSAMRSLFIESPPVRYADIGGQAGVIKKLKESVEWPLRHPEAFQRLGVKPPKGVLLYGPPGCSKTVLARACAYESGVNFLAVKGPELLNKFVGESERAVREIFRKARAVAPSIVFFDEIDALATSRTSSDAHTGSSHEGVLTSLLNEMDGVQELVGVTIIAATNRPESIDFALMRPGRLDRILFVGPPDLDGRKEILKIRMSTMKVEDTVDINAIAAMTAGCSGAEMSALCQEAAILTMQSDINAPHISSDAFVAAAKGTKRQITSTVLAKFERWKMENGGHHL